MKPEKKAKNIKVKNEKIPTKKGNSMLIIGVAGVVLLAVIGYFILSGGSTDNSSPNGTSEVKLPSYAYTNPMTLKGYKYATEHPDVLEQIPCYCGCGGHSGHRFLRDCFINDDWTYDDHASFCDVCIGEAVKVQDYLASGKTLKDARALIDQEYGAKYSDGKTNTPAVSDSYIPILSPKLSGLPAPAPADTSKLTLADNFKNLADGLKLTPVGVYTAYFTNIKLLIGTNMEEQYVTTMSEPDAFYGKKLIGMYSADYSPNPASWIELHDLGYDNTKDAAIRAHAEPGMKNIVYTRPLIYGHSQNVDNVLKLMTDPKSLETSYQTYKPLLDSVDNQNAGYAEVKKIPNKFSDMNYMSLTPVNGKIELIKAYNITDNKSIPSALDKYTPQIKDKVLIIKVTGDLATVQAEADNIDTAART
ncbi:MAG: hypothetical protein OIN66_14575 [Candidatus Methanoperedens sp.]|nr:hypothetical protein [Candidatus Methanoperedens sp.]